MIFDPRSASPQPALPMSLLEQLNSAIASCDQSIQAEQSTATACQQIGNILQALGRFDETIFWHTIALESQPNLANLYSGLGRLCLKQQNWQQAINYYEQAIRSDPNFALAYRELANLYAQQGQPDREIEYRYQTSLLRPDWATARNQLKLGNLLLNQQQTERAIECYQRSVELEPTYQTHYNLAVVLTGEARWAEAETAYRQALELNPDHADSYYGLCKVAELQDDLQAALQYCQQAYKLSPNSFATCYTLGTLLLKLNRWDEATAAYQQGLELNPDFAWSYHNLGYTLLKQGNLQEATVKLRRAAELLPESPWTFYHFADALGQIEAWDESIAALLRAIAIQPDLPGVYYKLGALVRRRLALGLENTVAYYQQSLPPQGKPPASEFYQAIAAQLIDVNQIDGAYLFARLALHLQPNQAQLYTQVEQLWAKREQLNQRLAELQQGIAENPESSWLYTELGNLLANQGETEQAIELHRQAAAQRGWQRSISKGYVFTHDWFTHTIPVWTEHLNRFVNAEVNALEIGSFEGMSTCWLLDYILTNPNARITCIDHYFQEVFDTNIVKTGSPEKVIKLTGDSHQLLAALEPETYNLIYIDGNHIAEHARQDAALSWPLLKPGGLLVFDDYEWSDANFPGQETKLGIDMFLHSVQPHVEILYQGYQMIIKKSAACPSILSDSNYVEPDSTVVSQTSAAN